MSESETTGVPQSFQKEQQNAPRRPVSRREFLKFLGTLAVTGPLVLADIEKTLLRFASDGLLVPGSTDKVVSEALTLTEKDTSSENPHFKPMHEILSEGIQAYAERTGKRVHYERSKDYADTAYYAQTIKEIAESIRLPKKPATLVDSLRKRLPPEAGHAFLQSDLRLTSFPELFATGSGFYNRFKSRHEKLIREDGYIQDYGEMFSLMETEGRLEIQELKKSIEEEREKKGSPVSAAFILETFLEKNQGALSDSIYDTALFLKFMARSDYQTAAYSVNHTHVEWHQRNILDEYQGLPYTAAAEEKDLINYIGKPYHSWNLTSLLTYFPKELVQASGIYRQLSTMKDQGLSKTRADLQTLKDLPAIEAELLKYAP